MRARSPKRAAQERLYARLRVEFLANRPWCEGCGSRPATEVHHKRGRVGGLLTDVRYWLAACSPCHRFITENPAEAKRLGLSESRLGGAA